MTLRVTEYSNGKRRRASWRQGFTLVELLLVVAIMGVVAAITLPNFVRSMRGNRLRSATRTVVMAGRYARSMCLLNQREMLLEFNIDAGRVSLYRLPDRVVNDDGVALPMFESGAFLEGAEIDAGISSAPTVTGEDGGTNGPAGGGEQELERELDQVRIEYVEIGEDERRFQEGACTVRYRSNGTCTPFTLRLVDEEGEGVLVSVDVLSTVTTTRD